MIMIRVLHHIAQAHHVGLLCNKQINFYILYPNTYPCLNVVVNGIAQYPTILPITNEQRHVNIIINVLG